ncbi:hypothetical protein BJX96DRAFT_156112 [Aspergillus floccosus]
MQCYPLYKLNAKTLTIITFLWECRVNNDRPEPKEKKRGKKLHPQSCRLGFFLGQRKHRPTGHFLFVEHGKVLFHQSGMLPTPHPSHLVYAPWIQVLFMMLHLGYLYKKYEYDIKRLLSASVDACSVSLRLLARRAH